VFEWCEERKKDVGSTDRFLNTFLTSIHNSEIVKRIKIDTFDQIPSAAVYEECMQSGTESKTGNGGAIFRR
jgi:hypothetical protein